MCRYSSSVILSPLPVRSASLIISSSSSSASCNSRSWQQAGGMPVKLLYEGSAEIDSTGTMHTSHLWTLDGLNCSLLVAPFSNLMFLCILGAKKTSDHLICTIPDPIIGTFNLTHEPQMLEAYSFRLEHRKAVSHIILHVASD